MQEPAQVVKQLWEGHAAGLVDGVVEQGGAPQGGVLAEEHAVDAGQTLLSGVDGPQTVFLSAAAAAPRLVTVVDAAEVVCTCAKDEGGFALATKSQQSGFINSYLKIKFHQNQ